jgi:hypothetical protein
MPARMIDFDALWFSDKLAACKESVRSEYAWMYGVAEGHGCFEINIASIHSKVSAIRPKLSSARIAAILEEFHRNGLLFIWNADKKYGFWTGSDKKGRLPPEGQRNRYRRSTPPVPVKELSEYESRFSQDHITRTSRQGLGVGLGLDRIGPPALDQRGEGPGEGGENQTNATKSIPKVTTRLITSNPNALVSENSTAKSEPQDKTCPRLQRHPP